MTLDHVGPLCVSVEDAAIVYGALTGGPAGSPRPQQASIASGFSRTTRVGVLRGYFTALLDTQVAAAFEAACERLATAGVTLADAEVPHVSDVASIYLHIVLAEGAAYHAKTLESRGDAYTTNVRLRLEMGRYILAEDYVRALRGRELLRREVDAALAGCDVLLLPSLAVPATRLGAVTVRVGGIDEPVRNITLRLTQLFNVTGHPAITVPCGHTVDGLPIGAQLVGARTPELLAIAAALAPYLGPGVSG
jgi:aspartyl-tRNA(Asn)/glutamyl-tRNA(Gln) amidotransferase subunit A